MPQVTHDCPASWWSSRLGRPCARPCQTFWSWCYQPETETGRSCQQRATSSPSPALQASRNGHQSARVSWTIPTLPFRWPTLLQCLETEAPDHVSAVPRSFIFPQSEHADGNIWSRVLREIFWIHHVPSKAILLPPQCQSPSAVTLAKEHLSIVISYLIVRIFTVFHRWRCFCCWYARLWCLFNTTAPFDAQRTFLYGFHCYPEFLILFYSFGCVSANAGCLAAVTCSYMVQNMRYSLLTWRQSHVRTRLKYVQDMFAWYICMLRTCHHTVFLYDVLAMWPQIQEGMTQRSVLKRSRTKPFNAITLSEVNIFFYTNRTFQLVGSGLNFATSKSMWISQKRKERLEPLQGKMPV